MLDMNNILKIILSSILAMDFPWTQYEIVFQNFRYISGIETKKPKMVTRPGIYLLQISMLKMETKNINFLIIAGVDLSFLKVIR